MPLTKAGIFAVKACAVMRHILTLLFCLLLVFGSFAQGGVGINNPTPDASALLDLTSTNRGLLVPRMTTAQRDGIPLPALSLLIFNTSTDRFEYFNGSAWVPLVAGGGWSITGNADIDANENFLGTTNARDVVIRTSNVERMRIRANSRVGIGTNNPTNRFEVQNIGIVNNNMGEGIAIRRIGPGGWGPQLNFSSWRGTPEAPESTQANDRLGEIRFVGRSGTSEATGAMLTAEATVDFLPGGDRSARLSFFTNDGGGFQRRITISPNGNLGLGLTDPLDRLHVMGNIRMVDGTEADGRILVSDANGRGTWQDPPPAVESLAWSLTGNAGTDPTTSFVGTTDNQPLVIRTTNVERARISNTGNMAIGSTNPNTRLDVVAGAPGITTRMATLRSNAVANNTGTSIALINSTSNVSNTGSEIASVTTNASTGLSELRFLVHGGGTFGALDERMRIQGNGNVGIGTNAPTQRLHVAGNIRMVDGNQAAGRVMTSNALGVGTWTDIGTLSSGTLDQAYDFGGAGAGRTIVADAGAVTIAGTDGLVSTGTLNSGAIAPAGAGVRMVWNPRKAAFRAGEAIGTEWNDANIGERSIALGFEVRASAAGSTAIGSTNTITAVATMGTAIGAGNNVSGPAGTALGLGNTSSGGEAYALGSRNTSSGEGSVTLGNDNISSGSKSVAIGEGNLARSRSEVVVGSFSQNYTPLSTTSFEPNDRIFVIGNGTANASRSNAMVVRKNGNTGLGTNTPLTRLHVNGAVTFTPVAFLADALPTLIDPGDRSYIRIGSNFTPENRIVVFENGTALGQMLIVECTATGSNGIRFTTSSNMSVSGTRDLNLRDTITFIWNGTRWLEISYANN